MTAAPIPPPPSEHGSDPSTDALLAGVLRKLLAAGQLTSFGALEHPYLWVVLDTERRPVAITEPELLAMRDALATARTEQAPDSAPS